MCRSAEPPGHRRCRCRMRAGLSGILTGLVLLAALVRCQLGGHTPQVVQTPASDPGLVTCTAWLAIVDEERVVLARRLVGDSADLLERIRIRQHQPEGTPRDILIRDVVGSLTKNCEVWPPRERPVGEVMDALY